jgi:uncharacterized RDD family membrane protein YckC
MKLAARLLLAALAFTLVAVPATAAPLTVSISGPSIFYVEYGCENVVFTASPSGGTPPYVLYEWKRDGISVGTNSPTLTLTYCSTVGQFAHFTDTIAVTVADSQGREARASKVLTIELLGCDVFGNQCVG